MKTPISLSESAALQGRLWGKRAREWADLLEPMQLPSYKVVLGHLALTPGTRFLDVGCGAGMSTRLAADAGCQVSGIDASEPLLEIARGRTPDGDFRVGELLTLPWPDGSFEAVTGFFSYQYATDPVAALRETQRTLVQGGKIGIVVWGPDEECEAVAHFGALGKLMPPRPPSAPVPLACDPQIAVLAAAAGFNVITDELVDCPWHFPDLPTALRALKSAGPPARVIEHAGEAAVDEALSQCLADFRLADGSYLFRNKFRALTGST